MKIQYVIISVAVVMSAAACNQARPVAPAAQQGIVQTRLSTEHAAAGESFEVRCMAWRNENERLDVPLDLRLPHGMSTVSRSTFATTVVASRAGRFPITCAYGDTQSVAEITIDPAAPQRIEVDMGEGLVPAGSTVPLHCVGVDLFGNHVPSSGAEFSVLGGGELVRGGIRVSRAGETQVQCRVPAWDHLGEAAPKVVRVTPAAPQRIYTEVHVAQACAHDEVAVQCHSVDAYGNVTELPEDFTVTGPGPVQQRPGSFHADLVGQYRAFCAAGQLRDRQGAAVEVIANAPAHWEAELDSTRLCYTQNKALPLQYRAWDAYGNRVQNFQVEMQANPPEGLGRDERGGFILRDEADYDITLRPATPAAAGFTLEPRSWRIRVDSTPPALEITTPARGAMLTTYEARQPIVGVARDKLSTITRLYVNGIPQSIPEGEYEVPIRTNAKRPWGVGIIDAWASDSCGNVATLSQAYLSSSSFAPPAAGPDPKARVSHAVVARLSQPLWDDNRRDTADDVATLLQRAIGDRSLVSYLPEPLWASTDTNHDGQLDRVSYACRWLPWGARENRTTGYEIERAGSPTYDAPEVEYFRVVDDGWHVALIVRNLRVPVQLRAYYDVGCAGNPHAKVDATVMAPAFRLEFTAHVNFENGQPYIRFEPTATHLTLPEGPPHLEADWGLLGRDSTWGLIGRLGISQTLDAALNRWVQSYANLLQDVVDSELAQHLERLLQKPLQSLRLEHSLAMPTPWRGGLAVYSGVDAVTLRGPEGDGHGELSLWSQLVPHGYGLTAPPSASFKPPSQGPIRHTDAPLPDLTLEPNQIFALAVQDDLINQLMWGLWYSGAFTVPDLNELGLSGVSVPHGESGRIGLFFTLPPVIEPSDSENGIKVGLGDVFVEADIDLHRMLDQEGTEPPPGHQRLHFTMFVSGTFDARLTLDRDHARLKVEKLTDPRLHVQIVDVSDRGFQAVATHFIEDTLNDALPKLMTTWLGEFPLPALQVGMLPGIPEGTVWTLSHSTLSRPANGTGTVLSGTLQAR